MTPEEKIESLREWAQRRLDNYKASAWGDGFTAAVQEIRDIIDPPAPQWRKCRMIRPLTNEPSIGMWATAFHRAEALEQEQLVVEGCLICGGHLRPERWEVQDGILVSGKWRCQTDPEHIVTKEPSGPLVPKLECW